MPVDLVSQFGRIGKKAFGRIVGRRGLTRDDRHGGFENRVIVGVDRHGENRSVECKDHSVNKNTETSDSLDSENAFGFVG